MTKCVLLIVELSWLFIPPCSVSLFLSSLAFDVCKEIGLQKSLPTAGTQAVCVVAPWRRHTHVHGQDAAGDELSVLPDGKVPRLDSHQIIKGELQYQTSLCTNLEEDHIAAVILHPPSVWYRFQ